MSSLKGCCCFFMYLLLCVLFLPQSPLQSKKERGRTHGNKLEKVLQDLLEIHGEGWTEELRGDLPRSFQRHGDLVLLGDNCFSLPRWKKIGTAVKPFQTHTFFFLVLSVQNDSICWLLFTFLDHQQLWSAVAKGLGAKRLAIMSRISRDGFRSPVVTMLLGEHSWVKHVDNRIRYFLINLSSLFAFDLLTE